jgi:citrate synthase
MTAIQTLPGLEGVVAAETRISGVDGEAGELVIAGFPVEEIADKATFEEMVYLLWHDKLPNSAELSRLTAELAIRRDLPPITHAVLKAAAEVKTPVMDALGMAAATLALGAEPDKMDGDQALRSAPDATNGVDDRILAIVARFATIVAAYWRILQGNDPIAPRPDLAHAANYLFMFTGDMPTPDRIRALETYLCTVADHGLNASTFTARVIVSTRSDILSAVVGAVGALKGPLHGGAPGPALDMVFEIGVPERAEAYLRAKLERGERLMGFGHRIYRVRDPRADVLAEAAARLYRTDGDKRTYALALHVEQTALRLLEELKPGRRLHTNVEFYTALLLHGIGLPTELFAPTFALARVAGWIAHCLEQQRLDRLIRPQSVYIGAHDRHWNPAAMHE